MVCFPPVVDNVPLVSPNMVSAPSVPLMVLDVMGLGIAISFQRSRGFETRWWMITKPLGQTCLVICRQNVVIFCQIDNQSCAG